MIVVFLMLAFFDSALFCVKKDFSPGKKGGYFRGQELAPRMRRNVILSRAVSGFEFTDGVLHRVHWLNVTPSEESGKRRGDIEFAPLRQTDQVSDRSPPIEEQEYPTFPAWELAGKRSSELARGYAEHGRCDKGSFLGSKIHHLSSPL